MARFCTNCGAGKDDAQKFCVSCGERFATPPEPMSTTSKFGGSRQRSCPKCSTPQHTDNAYCTHCGFEMPTSSQSAENEQQQASGRNDGPPKSEPRISATDDFYAVLGLTRSCSRDDVQSAYRRLAKEFHPDRHQNEGEKALADYAQQMTLISEAYEVLSDPTARVRYDRFLDGDISSASETFSWREPNADECMFCAHHPVANATLRRNVGLVYMRRYAKFEVTACRGCGLHLARSMQNSTLAVGWFGLISFFANFVAVIGNGAAIIRFGRLDDPMPPTERVGRPRAEPSYQGRSIFARAGVYVAIAVMVAAGIGISRGTPNYNWKINECVATKGGKVTGVTSCSAPNSGVIIGFANNQINCPQAATNYFTEHSQDPNPGRVVCVQSDSTITSGSTGASGASGPTG